MPGSWRLAEWERMLAFVVHRFSVTYLSLLHRSIVFPSNQFLHGLLLNWRLFTQLMLSTHLDFTWIFPLFSTATVRYTWAATQLSWWGLASILGPLHLRLLVSWLMHPAAMWTIFSLWWSVFHLCVWLTASSRQTFSVTDKEKHQICFRDLKKINLDTLSKDLQHLSSVEFSSVTKPVDFYHRSLSSVLDLHTPVRTRTIIFSRSAPGTPVNCGRWRQMGYHWAAPQGHRTHCS